MDQSDLGTIAVLGVIAHSLVDHRQSHHLMSEDAALEEEVRRQLEQEDMEAAMKAEIEAEKKDQEKPVDNKPKKLNERMAAYEAQTTAAPSSTTTTPARAKVGSVKMPDAFTKKEEGPASPTKTEASATSARKGNIADRWNKREEEPTPTKTADKPAVEAKADKSKFQEWNKRVEGKAEEKPVEKAIDKVEVVKADKSKFEEWQKRSENPEAAQVVGESSPRKTNVEVKADKSKFEEWNKRAEGKAEEKPIEKAIDKVEVVHADKSKFEEWNKRAEGKAEEKPLEKAIDKVEVVHADKSKFQEWQKREQAPEETAPAPSAAPETPQKANMAQRWNPEAVTTPPPVHRGELVMSFSARSRPVADRYKPEEQAKATELEKEKPAAADAVARKTSVVNRYNPTAAAEPAKDAEKPKPSPAKGGVAKRWDPVSTPYASPKKDEKKDVGKVDVAKRWPDAAASSSPASTPASSTPAASESSTPSRTGVTHGNVTKRWNPAAASETTTPSKTAETSAPRSGNKLAGRWNVGAEQAATPTGSKASELEEIRRLKEQQKQEEATNTGAIAGPAYADSEEAAIIAHLIMANLKGDKDVQLSLDGSKAPGAELADGIAMCKLFDRLNQGVLDVRVVNKKADETAAKVENWNLVIGSARSVDCRGLHIVQSEACASGNESQIQLVLWETIRVGLEQRSKRAKVYLETVFPDTKIQDVLKWSGEQLLTQWATKFLASHGSSRKVDSLTADLKDGEALAAILRALSQAPSDASAGAIAEAANKMDGGAIASAKGIEQGVQWQMYVLLATLFLKASTQVW